MDAASYVSSGGKTILFPLLTDGIRRIDPEGELRVESIVSFALFNNKQVDTLFIDRPSLVSNGSLAENLLTELISRPEIKTLILSSSLDSLQARDASKLLSRSVIPNVVKKEAFCINLWNTHTSAAQADELFTTLLKIQVPLKLEILWGDSYADEGLVDSFSRYLRDPTSLLIDLRMKWPHFDSDDYMQTLFRTTCHAISKSPTLKTLRLHNFPVRTPAYIEQALQDVANAIATSACIKSFCIGEQGVTDLTMTEQVKCNLMRMPCVQDFDLLLLPKIKSLQWWTMHVERTTPFKQVLSQNIPLALWPLILAKANKNNRFVSHSSLSFLYLLVKEKNDVLLQNVHCRPLRTRSSFRRKLIFMRILCSLLPRQ